MTEILGSDATFTAPERRVVARLAELMIPAQADRPGASDPTILDQILSRLAPHSETMTAALAEMSTADGIDPLSDEAFMALVDERMSPDIRNLFQTQVVISYFEDPRVMAAIGLPPRPAFPEGYEVAATDWDSLLAPVRGRGSAYRKDTS